jgi:hypothetical protein
MISWNPIDNKWHGYDDSAFIFSLNNKTKHRVNKNTQEIILKNKEFLVNLGYEDICIRVDAHNRNDNLVFNN